MKDVELRLLSELMKNSRRSDREIAKAIGVSQPTISRLIKKLEKEGKIKEYTMIPDFGQLGYNLMAVVFFGKQDTMTKEERLVLRGAALELEKKNPHATMMVVSGMGLNKGRMLIIFYRDYSSYSEDLKVIRNLPHSDPGEIESFLVDLNDERNFRTLSLKEVARHFLA
jgi:DNA-binding Lrp family transcriptional regulator